MDRFLRFNRLGSNASGSFGGQSSVAPTIVVQPADPPPIPAFIQNQSLEARVACDPSNQPALEATVRGRAVLKSDYGDGTNGYTKIEAPSSNSSVTAGPGGVVLDTPGIGPQRVLTCMDPTGLAYWATPTQLLSPVDPVQCYLRLGNYDVELATNWDQPTGKLRLKIQPFSSAGQILTAQDNNGTCQWQDPAPFPPIPASPTVYTSNVAIPINLTTTNIYPGADINSTTEFWSMTVDTTFVVATGGGTVVLSWALFNQLGVQYGTTVTTSVPSAGTILRIVYQYAFRRVSPTEVRLTATSTSTIASGTTVVRLPLSYVSVDPIGGIPFIRMAKSISKTVTVVSMSAYYNALNWESPAPVAFSAMREGAAMEELPIEGEDVSDPKAPIMEPPALEEFPIDTQGVGDKEMAILAELGAKLQVKLTDVFENESKELQDYNDQLIDRLGHTGEELEKSLEEYAQEIKRQKVV